MHVSLLQPVLSTQDVVPAGDGVYQLLPSEAIRPTRAVRLKPLPLTFGRMRLDLMREFREAADVMLPREAASAAIGRIDMLDLWPRSLHAWKLPWGQFLLDLVPLLDDPDTVLGRPGARAALRGREVRP